MRVEYSVVRRITGPERKIGSVLCFMIMLYVSLFWMWPYLTCSIDDTDTYITVWTRRYLLVLWLIAGQESLVTYDIGTSDGHCSGGTEMAVDFQCGRTKVVISGEAIFLNSFE